MQERNPKSIIIYNISVLSVPGTTVLFPFGARLGTVPANVLGWLVHTVPTR